MSINPKTNCFTCGSGDDLITLKCNHKMCQDCLVEGLQQISTLGTALVCHGSTKDATGSDETNCGETISLQWVNQLQVKDDLIGPFEDALNELHYRIKRSTTCNKCKGRYIRQNTSHVRLACDTCKVDFCFYCGNQWKAGTGICGNGCTNDDPLITALTTRSNLTAKISLSGTETVLPLARLCVDCGNYCERQANESTGKLISCKHTTCSRCNAVFCHSCLSLYDTKVGKWPRKCSGNDSKGTTVGAYSKCTVAVAPLQTKQDLLEIERKLYQQ